jgi:hypothetical protein
MKEVIGELSELVSQSASRDLLWFKHGDSLGTQRKGNVSRWKPIPSNGSQNVTVDISVCVTVNYEV